MIRKELVDPRYRNYSWMRDSYKKRFTYCRGYDNSQIGHYYDDQMLDLWMQAKYWKEDGLAFPPILSMGVPLNDGFYLYKKYGLGGDSAEEITNRIILW